MGCVKVDIYNFIYIPQHKHDSLPPNSKQPYYMDLWKSLNYLNHRRNFVWSHNIGTPILVL